MGRNIISEGLYNWKFYWSDKPFNSFTISYKKVIRILNRSQSLKYLKNGK